MSENNYPIMEMVEGLTLWRWPEFIALAKRLGIPLDNLTTDVTICIPSRGMVTVEHTYFPEDQTLVTQETLNARIEKLERESREVSTLPGGVNGADDA